MTKVLKLKTGRDGGEDLFKENKFTKIHLSKICLFFVEKLRIIHKITLV